MAVMTFAYIDEPPFVSPNIDGGWPRGCDAELAAVVLDMMGVTHREAVAVSFADLLPGVAAHHWELNTALFVTPERQELVRFSRPVWALADGLLVRASEQDRLGTYEGIALSSHARLGVVAGQIQARTALVAGVSAERIVTFNDPATLMNALLSGAVDAYASVACAHRAALGHRPHDALVVSDLGQPEHAGRAGSIPACGAFSFAREDEAFASAFDAVLERFLGSDAHAEILQRNGLTLRGRLGSL
jgi:polar amino acid transport system substrate-binding protein